MIFSAFSLSFKAVFGTVSFTCKKFSRHSALSMDLSTGCCHGSEIGRSRMHSGMTFTSGWQLIVPHSFVQLAKYGGSKIVKITIFPFFHKSSMTIFRLALGLDDTYGNQLNSDCKRKLMKKT